MIRYLILGLLEAGVARHGYAFMKEYREGSGVEISIGNVYRELAVLLRKGWVRRGVNPPGVDPRRTPYEITTTGRTALNEWLTDADAAALPGRQDELAMRVFLVTRVGETVPESVLDRWREALALRLGLLRQRREVIASRRGKGTGGRSVAEPLLIARRLQYVSADLDFVTQLQARMPRKADGTRRATKRDVGSGVARAGGRPSNADRLL